MTDWPFASPIKPMKARVRETPPQGEGWVYEPKWDGFRAVAWGGTEPKLESRNGKPLLRYFPELLPALEQLPAGTVVDGEVVVVVDDVTQFDQLQSRIHPAASRIELLSGEIPAELVAFDLLGVGGEDLRAAPWSERRTRLERLFAALESPWHLTPVTSEFGEAERWFSEYEGAGCDGIICKLDDGAYVEDKRVWIKWKHRRDCDCVVGGYRVHKDGDKIGSILLGLFDDDDNFHFMGHCSGFSNHDRVELLRQFEQIRWSTGKELDWIPVSPGVVVQISYDQLEGGRFRHATRFERWRPDKPAEECTLDQFERPEGVGFAEVVS